MKHHEVRRLRKLCSLHFTLERHGPSEVCAQFMNRKIILLAPDVTRHAVRVSVNISRVADYLQGEENHTVSGRNMNGSSISSSA